MAIWIQVILDIKENDASLLFPFFFFFFYFQPVAYFGSGLANGVVFASYPYKGY